MEDPQKDQTGQSGNAVRKNTSFKDSFVLYNNKFASIRFGFNFRSPYVAIAKVLEEQKGKRPVAGTQMYDNDHAIFFSFNIHELFALEQNIDDLVSGKMSPMMFIHSSRGDNNKKVFFIGKGIDGDHEDEFGIACMICPTERTGAVILDDPIESAVFFAGKMNVAEDVDVDDTDLIKRWFKLAIEGKMNTACDRQSFARNNDNGNNGGGFKPRFNNFRRDGNGQNGGSSATRNDDRPVVSRFGSKSSGNSSKQQENPEDLFDASDEDVMG